MSATPENAGRSRTIYRYGWIAWVWRGFSPLGLAPSALLAFAALRFGDRAFRSVFRLPSG